MQHVWGVCYGEYLCNYKDRSKKLLGGKQKKRKGQKYSLDFIICSMNNKFAAKNSSRNLFKNFVKLIVLCFGKALYSN